METLNLCEILKGHKGEIFWNPLVGNLQLKKVDDCILYFQYGNSVIDIPYHGKDMNNNISVFPSKDQRDWNKWIKEQKAKIPKTCSELCATNNWHIYAIEHQYKEDIYSTKEGITPIEKSALALLKIHQLIEAGYGGNVTKFDRQDIHQKPYMIEYDYIRDEFIVTSIGCSLIAFHSEEQAEKFLRYPENVQLLRDYHMVWK